MVEHPLLGEKNQRQNQTLRAAPPAPPQLLRCEALRSCRVASTFRLRDRRRTEKDRLTNKTNETPLKTGPPGHGVVSDPESTLRSYH